MSEPSTRDAECCMFCEHATDKCGYEHNAKCTWGKPKEPRQSSRGPDHWERTQEWKDWYKLPPDVNGDQVCDNFKREEK